MESTLLPLLYKCDKAGRVRYWECRVEGDTFYTRAGLLKTRDTHKWKEHRRNARHAPGHGSYTSPEQVAIEHAQSEWKEKKRNDNMYETIEEAETPRYVVPIPPVLAMKYKDLTERHENSNSKYKFPEYEFFAQPKLDGERCTVSWIWDVDANGQPTEQGSAHLHTRSRNEIPYCEHLRDIFTRIYRAFGAKNPKVYEFHFDGEVIEPGVSRNKMRSTISRIKEKHVDNEKLTIYLFDMITVYGMPFSQRYKMLQTIMGKVTNANVKLVPILSMVKLGTADVEDALARALDMGFEGIVMRDPSMVYPTSNHRIEQMIKHKPLQSKEYKIVGAHEGMDAHAGMIVWEVQDPDAEYVTFDVTPSWKHDDRKEAWELYQEDPTKFIGQLLTVVYRDLNEYGKPVEACGASIRDPFDMDTPYGNKPERSYSHRSYGGEDDWD